MTPLIIFLVSADTIHCSNTKTLGEIILLPCGTFLVIPCFMSPKAVLNAEVGMVYRSDETMYILVFNILSYSLNVTIMVNSLPFINYVLDLEL